MKKKCPFVPWASGILALAFTLGALPLRAQLVADGATNTLSIATNSVAGDVTVGTNGSFTLLILSDNALLTNSANGLIGVNATAKSNEVRLTSPTARWQMGGNLLVGSNGAVNRLVVSNGAFLNNNNGRLAFRVESSNNFALVTGSGSLWSNANILTIGNSGRDNHLIVSNGGWVVSQNGDVGGNASASNNLALVTGSGSVWSNAFNLRVGALAPCNRLVIEAGGLMHSGSSVVGDRSSASNNQALVTGPGSLWTNRDDLTIGFLAGFNRLVVSNGAAVRNRSGSVGASSAPSNHVVVTGSGSVWSNQASLFLGASSVGNRADVSDGGWLACTDGSVGSGFSANSNTVVLSAAGSGWNNLGTLKVGDGGSGNTLIASNGATVLSSNAFIGASTSLGNNNFALLTGAGTLWSNRNDFTVGNFSVGNQLVVSNGATLFVGGNLYIGANSGSGGNRVVVDGGRLRVTNASGVGAFEVRRGTNTLNAGLLEADRLLITNPGSLFQFKGGTLSARSTTVNNGLNFGVGISTSAATFVLSGNGLHDFSTNLLALGPRGTLTGNGTIVGGFFAANGSTLSPGLPIGKIVWSNSLVSLNTTVMEIASAVGPTLFTMREAPK